MVTIRHAVRTFGVLAAVTAIAVGGSPATAQQPARKLSTSAQEPPLRQPMITQLIVKLRNPSAQELTRPLGADRVMTMSNRAGVALQGFRPMSGGASVLKLDRPMSVAEAREVAARLATDKEVEYAEPDYPVKALQIVPPDSSYAARHWHYYAPNQVFTSGGKSVTAVGGANLPGAWSVTQGNPAIVVAVLDTGIVLEHPELAGKFAAVPGYDFVSSNAAAAFGAPPNLVANDGDGRDPDPRDPGDWIDAAEQTDFPGACDDDDDPSNNKDIGSSWHGTHMAGTIAGVWGGGASTAGIAPNVRLQSVRVLGKCGGSSSDVIDAIRWAAGLSAPFVNQSWQDVGVTIGANPTPARVINLSLGSQAPCGTAYQQAISEVIAFGVLVVAASGNSGFQGPGAVTQPGNCSGVLAVTAHAINGDSADYANIGPEVAISAPGGGDPTWIATPIVEGDNGWYTWSSVMFGFRGPNSPGPGGQQGPAIAGFTGTSSATAHVSAVAALLWSAVPSATPGQIQSWIVNSARPHPAGSYCDAGEPGENMCGAGLLDASAAMARAAPPPPLSGGGGGGGALPLAHLLLLLAAAFVARARRGG